MSCRRGRTSIVVGATGALVCGAAKGLLPQQKI